MTWKVILRKAKVFSKLGGDDILKDFKNFEPNKLFQ